MSWLNKIVSCVMACVFCCAAQAQDTPAAGAYGSKRLCTPDDLVGHTFQMVDFNETPPLAENQFVKEFPYDYLSFYANSFYGYLATNNPMKTAKQAQIFMQPNQGEFRTYSLSKDGELILMVNGRIQYTYRCVAVLQSQGDYLVGDLVFYGYTRRHRSELYKLFRRWF